MVTLPPLGLPLSCKTEEPPLLWPHHQGPFSCACSHSEGQLSQQVSKLSLEDRTSSSAEVDSAQPVEFKVYGSHGLGGNTSHGHEHRLWFLEDHGSRSCPCQQLEVNITMALVDSTGYPHQPVPHCLHFFTSLYGTWTSPLHFLFHISTIYFDQCNGNQCLKIPGVSVVVFHMPDFPLAFYI